MQSNNSRFLALLLLIMLSLMVADMQPAKVEASLPPVDRVVVYKSRRLLQLRSGNTTIRSFRVALGRNPVGHKHGAGDCRTPEGVYLLDHRSISSHFHKSIHISYPNEADLAAAKRMRIAPGGDIMIHGLPQGFEDLADRHFTRNWTKGCIAVSNAEIDEIWRLVPDGTPIEIMP